MTNEEAIKELKQIPSHIGEDCDGYELRAIAKAIEALEKQKPKKVKSVDAKSYTNKTNFLCPSCGSFVGYSEAKCYLFGKENNFCWSCGQAIDWSEEE